MRGVRFTIREKERALKMWLRDHEDILCVARKMKCAEQTLYRWKKRYDGTRESLKNKSSRPHTPHPNSHTPEEALYIRDLFEAQPGISYAEALGVLRQKYAYSRTYHGFYRYVVKSGIRPKKQIEKYKPQRYDTPEMFGGKNANGRQICASRMFSGRGKRKAGSSERSLLPIYHDRRDDARALFVPISRGIGKSDGGLCEACSCLLWLSAPCNSDR